MSFLPTSKDASNVNCSFTDVGKSFVLRPHIGFLKHPDSDQFHETSPLLFFSQTHQSVTLFGAEFHDMGIGSGFCTINLKFSQLI